MAKEADPPGSYRINGTLMVPFQGARHYRHNPGGTQAPQTVTSHLAGVIGHQGDYDPSGVDPAMRKTLEGK
jgi:hypothetical protein